jgi:hypothetical protein
MSVALSDARFDAGRVLSNAFSAIGKNFPLLAALAFLFFVIPQTLSIGSLVYTINRDGASTSRWLEYSWLFSAIPFLLQFFLQAAVLQAATSALSGRQTSFGECAMRGLTHFLPLLFVGLLAAIGEMFGFLFFIVPGILAYLRWCVAGPVQIAEGKNGVDALGRSAALTLNHRGVIFGIKLLAGVIYFAATSAGSSQLVGAMQGARLGQVGDFGVASAVPLLIQALFGAAASVISLNLTAAIYFELRRVKEGVGIDEVAAAFD